MNVLELSRHRRRPLPEADRVDIWIVDLDRRADGFPAPIGLIDESEREQAARFRFDEDRRRFVARRAVLRELLGRHLGLHPSTVQIDRGPGTKPEIRSPDAVHFNTAASGATALVAISDAEVGVDVERVGDRSDGRSLARRWLTTAERSRIDRLTLRARRQAVFACLVKKEAVLKAAGVGLGVDPSLISVPIDDVPGQVEIPTLNPSSWWVGPLALGGDLIGALATPHPGRAVKHFVTTDASEA